MSLELDLNRSLINEKRRSISSPSTTQRRIERLPKIEHPSRKYSSIDQNSLNIRGKSSDGRINSNEGDLIRNEYLDDYLNQSKTHRQRRRSSSFRQQNRNEENVRLPIFGYRPSSIASSNQDDHQREREREKETPRTSRLVLDEFETILKEKIRSQFNDVKTKFRHASETNDSNGFISRPALQHLIASIFGIQRQISPHQIDLLLERFNLKHLNKISFDEFISGVFRNDEDFDFDGRSSRQISSRRERNESSSKKSSTQMFLILKEKLRTKNNDLVKLCPSIVGGPPSRIFKAQFYNSIIEMGYRMKDTEFDKLWDKFDTDGYKAVQSEKFLKRLTNESIGEETHRDSTPNSKKFLEDFYLEDQHDDEEQRTPTKTNHRQSTDLSTPRISTSRDKIDENQIQKWLNHKFPHGFQDLEKSLERLDTKQSGNISQDRFLNELKRFGLKLEKHLLDFFLKRLNVDLSLTNGLIPYREVINAFKEQSDPTKKRINADNPILNNESRQTSLERQIEMCLAINYERVKSSINRFDRNHSGRITTNELRSIIEDLIDYTLKPDEYYQLLKSVPQDESGKVKYNEYLKIVLDRSLIRQEDEQNFHKSIEWNLIQPKEIRSKFNVDQIKKQRDSQFDQYNSTNVVDQQSTRSIDQLRNLLKSLIRDRYKDVEEQFQKLDRSSYGELTKDLLFQLFRRLSIEPEVNRSEIDLIWSRCHLKENGNLDFYQFLREFGYSKRSAHYPNAKQNPPRRGDADFLLTSRKLYGDSVLVHGTALNAIRSNWNELRREFAQLDPYRTGFIQSDEFDEILIDLCPSVNQEDLDRLRSKFQDENQNRMNYIRFLRYHSPLPEYLSLIDHSSSSPSANSSRLPSIQEHSPRSQSNHSVLSQVSTKIRRKLSDSYKDLRRAFKEIDRNNSGSIRVKQFQEVLDKFQCHLNDEQFYTLISQLDTQMNGTINYNYFLQQYVKNT